MRCRECFGEAGNHPLALEEVAQRPAAVLAAGVGGARGGVSRRRGGGGERPHDVVDGLGGRHGPDLYHPAPRRATSRLNGRPAGVPSPRFRFVSGGRPIPPRSSSRRAPPPPRDSLRTASIPGSAPAL